MGQTTLGYQIRSWILARIDSRCELAVATRKRELLSRLEGNILEIGPGSGVNFGYFTPRIRWSGIEPNERLHRQLRQSAAARGIELVELSRGDALDVLDESMDAVVSMFALCTVDDPAATLRHALRILKPGGRLVFLEHVTAPLGSNLRRLQHLVEPAWSRFADGCRLACDTFATIRAAGFSSVDCEAFDIPFPLLSPHIAGTATKGSARP